jgi:hypothetical protein
MRPADTTIIPLCLLRLQSNLARTCPQRRLRTARDGRPLARAKQCFNNAGLPAQPRLLAPGEKQLTLQLYLLLFSGFKQAS